MPKGVYPHKRQSLEERFWSKVSKSEGCWNWTAATYKGYGIFTIPKQGRWGNIVATHMVYQLTKGNIPEGLEIDHLCRNPTVNPEHLEAVTHRENILRGNTFAAEESRRTHCPKGHPLEGTNLCSNELKRGMRRCRICENEQQRNRYYAKKLKNSEAKAWT